MASAWTCLWSLPLRNGEQRSAPFALSSLSSFYLENLSGKNSDLWSSLAPNNTASILQVVSLAFLNGMIVLKSQFNLSLRFYLLKYILLSKNGVFLFFS